MTPTLLMFDAAMLGVVFVGVVYLVNGWLDR
jgi:hypothetical protein